MKTIYLTLIAVLGLSLGINAQDINTSESSLTWHGGDVTGKKHYGGLSFKSGSITTSNGKLTGGAFEIDMTSIDITQCLNHFSVLHLAARFFAFWSSRSFLFRG